MGRPACADESPRSEIGKLPRWWRTEIPGPLKSGERRSGTDSYPSPVAHLVRVRYYSFDGRQKSQNHIGVMGVSMASEAGNPALTSRSAHHGLRGIGSFRRLYLALFPPTTSQTLPAQGGGFPIHQPSPSNNRRKIIVSPHSNHGNPHLAQDCTPGKVGLGKGCRSQVLAIYNQSLAALASTI